ncbi:predicted protein [Ostreococcus lucimarinus CCE9901]|uniref:Uncharacterized protein n=1 Tax=Ostreococcus lucimarinus (strain CCE9901) TaxID=436017 RepID=A4S9Q3_OSTLU|nr:predicted protein [Ostreococcus lucimarinus CCE9901]ABP00528.1 predicted protein [Ostreococcus lucimarinus CCE9901]|eukprot:XP_001422211.1 predicted protein [Ostreococcus lucimarinus CCE9901]
MCTEWSANPNDRGQYGEICSPRVKKKDGQRQASDSGVTARFVPSRERILIRRDRGRFAWKSRFPDDVLRCTRNCCIIGCADESS